MAGRWEALHTENRSPPARRKSGKPPDCLRPVEVSMNELADGLMNIVDILTCVRLQIMRTSRY